LQCEGLALNHGFVRLPLYFGDHLRHLVCYFIVVTLLVHGLVVLLLLELTAAFVHFDGVLWETVKLQVGRFVGVDCLEGVPHLLPVFLFELKCLFDETADVHRVLLLQEAIQICLGPHTEDPHPVVFDIGDDHKNKQ
jgi:hypothetical protein